MGINCVALVSEYVMLCAIWYHLYNLKNMKNTYGGVILLVKLQDSVECGKIRTRITRNTNTFYAVYLIIAGGKERQHLPELC